MAAMVVCALPCRSCVTGGGDCNWTATLTSQLTHFKQTQVKSFHLQSKSSPFRKGHTFERHGSDRCRVALLENPVRWAGWWKKQTATTIVQPQVAVFGQDPDLCVQHATSLPPPPHSTAAFDKDCTRAVLRAVRVVSCRAPSPGSFHLLAAAVCVRRARHFRT